MHKAVFERNNMHWMYFLSLEEDLIALARSIEFAEPNFNVFSIECTRLLLAACSEVDVVMKLLATPHSTKEPKKVANLGECRELLAGRYPIISEASVLIPRHGLRLTPWASWREGKQPAWWDGYNDVKHRRAEHYAQATLVNVLNAIAGLLVALMLYLRQIKIVDIIMPATWLLRPYHLQGSYCISPDGHLIDLRPEHFRNEDEI